MTDERALTDADLNRIQKDIFAGFYNDRDVNRLFETILIQKRVLKTLFSFFKSETLRRVSTADPIRNSELAYLKELVGMDRIVEW